MGERRLAKHRITTIEAGASRERIDVLAAEEPMEVRVGGDTVAVTMRTPGHDFELAVGFCLTEGLLDAPDDLATVRYCAGMDEEGRNTYNVVDVTTRSGRAVAPELRRNLYTTSSCGVCGTASLDAVRKHVAPVHDDVTVISAESLTLLPERLRAAQSAFERTGGLHAAGLFTADDEVVCVREDVGRHNAVDKVIGWAATAGRLPLDGHVLMVSGRVAFEIAQKALVARIPIVAAVSAPSSLAVELAVDAGMTLVGFLRGSSMNVYAGAERVVASGPNPYRTP
jgi:FdhD protein